MTDPSTTGLRPQLADLAAESNPSPAAPAPRLAGRAARFASLVYEGILLGPILLVASFPSPAFIRGAPSGLTLALFQLWLVIVAGAYFCYCWSRTGQTLPLKTWRLRVTGPDGRPPTVMRALARFLAALMGALLAGTGFWWAFLDRDGLFLHDRLVGTRIVVQER